MPPQQQIQPNMEPNKNSKVNTVLLIVVIILLAVGVYMLWSKNNSTEKVFIPRDSSSEDCGFDGKKCLPSGQTQTNQNPTGPDYQPSATNSQTTTLQINQKMNTDFGVITIPSGWTAEPGIYKGAIVSYKIYSFADKNKYVAIGGIQAGCEQFPATQGYTCKETAQGLPIYTLNPELVILVNSLQQELK